MYYCKSRFYVPKWRRWLNNDSINYLEPQNITCLNLFAYCNNNLVMYVDPTGDFAISILALIIGGIIGACIGFGTAAYIDSKDGQMFNGDVKWYDYLGATALGGIVGAGVGALATIAFTASIPTFGLIGSGGALSFGITGAVELTISGTLGLLAAGALGAVYMFSKGNGPRIGHNHYENKQFRQLCRKHNLTKTEEEKLHSYISHQNYTYHEIEELIFELFGK